MSKASKAFGRDSQLHDTSFGWRFVNPRLDEVYGTDGMGETAENLVDQYGISREDQDAFAAWSQQKAAQSAAERGEECVSVSILGASKTRWYSAKTNSSNHKPVLKV